MSLHPSLKSLGKTRKQRTVLKRIERIKYLMDKNLWKEGDSVVGLPKIKTIRIKFKKEKAKVTPVAEGAAGAAATPSAGAKPAAGAKSTAGAKK
ncbi:MAG: small basic protein [Candidatus Omnitrophota bacterium]|nr:small basic protein [Candidatus Omnitrophota bacterium]